MRSGTRLVALSLAALAAGLPIAASPALAGSSNTWHRAYEAGVIGGGFAAGEAIGRDAIAGYEGGTFDGGTGPQPFNRPCSMRKPVYDSSGAFIGYRGIQLC